MPAQRQPVGERSWQERYGWHRATDGEGGGEGGSESNGSGFGTTGEEADDGLEVEVLTAGVPKAVHAIEELVGSSSASCR